MNNRGIPHFRPHRRLGAHHQGVDRNDIHRRQRSEVCSQAGKPGSS